QQRGGCVQHLRRSAQSRAIATMQRSRRPQPLIKHLEPLIMRPEPVEGRRAHTKSAVAIAAMPSPRPVNPRPSVVVAARLTGAPIVLLMISSASARRELSFGRSPINWTATLAMSKPAARTRAAVSERKAAPGALDHLGSVVP